MLLGIIVESCATKIFLTNPDMDQDLYRRQAGVGQTSQYKRVYLCGETSYKLTSVRNDFLLSPFLTIYPA